MSPATNEPRALRQHEERSSRERQRRHRPPGLRGLRPGDMDTLRSLMTPDVVQSVPGNTPVSGEHKGVDAVLGYYAKLGEMTGGTLSADLQSVKDDGPDKGLAVHRLTAHRNGQSYDQVEKLHITLSGGQGPRAPR